MTNDNQAANRFLSQLQAQAASNSDSDPAATPQQIVINRPVRCTFYVGTPPTTPAKKRGNQAKSQGGAE